MSKMKKVKLSIIIPTYNSERTIEECLNSILNQNYKDYEIIIVDNNSNDKTKMIIQKHLDNPRLKYIFEPIISRGKARNTGEKTANGEIILMTDSDCTAPKNWINDMIKPIINNECDAVQGFEEGLKKGYWAEQEHIRFLKRWKKRKNNILGNIDTKNLAIKKSVLKKINYSNPEYANGNDTYISIRLEKNKCKVKFMKNIRVKHAHPDSMLNIIKKYINRGYWCSRITKDNEEFLKETDFSKISEQIIWKTLMFFPDIAISCIKEGPKYAFFDLVTGIAWRMGIIWSKVWGKIKQIKNPTAPMRGYVKS